MAVRIAALAAALICSSCTHDPLAMQPLVPETTSVTAPSSRPVPATRSLESKTIGVDPYSVRRPSNESGGSATPSNLPPARGGAWSPTPVYGVFNPSPPGPTTPVYGEMNPSPPGR